MANLLQSGIKQGSQKAREIASYFPSTIIREWEGELTEDEKAENKEYEEACHIEVSPFWDNSLIKEGMRVRHRLTNKTGFVKLENGGICGITFVIVCYDDGSEGAVYPNQIKLIGNYA